MQSQNTWWLLDMYKPWDQCQFESNILVSIAINVESSSLMSDVSELWVMSRLKHQQSTFIMWCLVYSSESRVTVNLSVMDFIIGVFHHTTYFSIVSMIIYSKQHDYTVHTVSTKWLHYKIQPTWDLEIFCGRIVNESLSLTVWHPDQMWR